MMKNLKKISNILILLLVPLLSLSQSKDCTIRDISKDLIDVNESKYKWISMTLENYQNYIDYRKYRGFKTYNEELYDMIGNVIFDLEKRNDKSIKFIILDLKYIRKNIIFVMARITKVDLSRDVKQISGTTAEFSGSTRILEDLSVIGTLNVTGGTSGNTMSATTFYSGSTDLSDLFITILGSIGDYVDASGDTMTGKLTTPDLSATTFNSDSITSDSITGDTISATTISAITTNTEEINYTTQGSGTTFGSIWFSGDSFNVVLADQDTYYAVAGMNESGTANNVTPNDALGTLTVHKSGTYLVNMNTSCKSATVNDFIITLHKNNANTIYENISVHRTTSSTNANVTASSSGIVVLDSEDILEIWVKRIDGGASSKTLTFTNANIVAHKVAG